MTVDPTVTIDAGLASAVLHTSEALAGNLAVSTRVTEQRILEVLLLLAESGAAPLRPDVKSCATADAVRSIVRDRPAHAWAAAAVAAELCRSESTLRRALQREGTSFRNILADERMRAARRFRSAFGCLPSEIRKPP